MCNDVRAYLQGWVLSISQKSLGDTIRMDSIFRSPSNSLSPVTNSSAFPFNAVEKFRISSLSFTSIFVRSVFSDKAEPAIGMSEAMGGLTEMV